jgi:hypothetical protein
MIIVLLIQTVNVRQEVLWPSLFQRPVLFVPRLCLTNLHPSPPITKKENLHTFKYCSYIYHNALFPPASFISILSILSIHSTILLPVADTILHGVMLYVWLHTEFTPNM